MIISGGILYGARHPPPRGRQLSAAQQCSGMMCQEGGFREEKRCVACGYGQYLVDKKKKPSTFCNVDGKKCRSGGIRTRGLLVPKRLKIQASSIPTKKQNQQTFFSFEGDCMQPLAGFCNSFSPKRKGILPELLHCVNTFSVIPVICEMWFVSSYLAPCVDALRKNSLPVRNSSSVMSHNPTPYCLNHPRWKGLNPRRCPVPFQKLFHIGGDGQKQEPFRQKFPQF